MTPDELLATVRERRIRLWREGDDLRFRAPPGALTPELRSELGRHKEELLERVPEGADRVPMEAPLSEEQLALWYIRRAAPDTTAFNVGFAARIRSRVDVPLLRDAVEELTRRHGTLRTTYHVDGDSEPYQRVHPETETDLATVDARGWSEEELDDRVRVDHAEPLDLGRGPVLRLRLYARAEEEHLLLITAHHIALDGWSMWQLLDELQTLYGEGRSRGSGVDAGILDDVPADYVDYVAWQREMLAGEAGRSHLAYWREALEGAPPVLELPTDRPRPPARSMEGATHPLEVPADLAVRLGEIARARGVTLYTLLLSAYFVLLHRYARQEDVVVGSVMAGRTRQAFRDTLGCFVNTVPLRATVAPDLPFSELVEGVRETVLRAAEHQEVPFRVITTALGVPRRPGVPPLCQALFVFQKPHRFTALASAFPGAEADGGGVDFGGMELEGYPLPQQEGQVDLALELMETGDGRLAGGLKYDTALYDEDTVADMGERLVRLLRSVSDDPDARISDLRLLSDEELEGIAIFGEPPPDAADATDAADPGDDDGAPWAETLHGTFVRRARRRPDATALTYRGEGISYGELERRSGRVAALLRSEGVGPGSVVALCVDRCPELVVGLLGILRAGAAYLPLDRVNPPERLGFMVEDAGAAAMVVHGSASGWLDTGDLPVVDLAQLGTGEGPGLPPEEAATDADATAYVIYTSGSTGRPKGVAVTHANVLSLLRASRPYFGFDDEDVWTFFHSAAFDFSVWEIFGALLFGGRLVVVPFEVSRDPEAFHALLRDEGVTILNQTPSAFLPLVRADRRAGRLGSLRRIVFGGEALDPASLAPWIERYGDRRPVLVNMYGITETTVHVTYRRITAEDARSGTGSVIGRPLPHLHAYVLGPGGEPVPPGVPGEIHVGGEGVAAGYVGRPELTAERFVPDPFAEADEARLYRTGDLARVLPTGELEYLGRVDDQVKIRGFRIELGEIDAVAGAHPGVRECATVVREDEPGDRRLVTYVVSDGGADDLRRELEDRVRSRLPDYMVPSALVFLDEMPLTANGKLDRDALPAPEREGAGATGADAPPRSELEATLVAIWEDVLDVRGVGVHDNFFELGGHSILVTRMVDRVRAATDVQVSIAPFFRAPTVAELAHRIETLTLSPADGRRGDDTGEAREEIVL